jgi:hypothetical protein
MIPTRLRMPNKSCTTVIPTTPLSTSAPGWATTSIVSSRINTLNTTKRHDEAARVGPALRRAVDDRRQDGQIEFLME